MLATGFKVMDADSVPTFAVTGSGGRSLSAFWDEHRLQAYEGVSIPGFPNLFSVFGPYGYVGSSYFALIETQTHHIIRCLKRAAAGRNPGRSHPGSQRPVLRRDDAPPAPPGVLAGQLPAGQQLLLRQERRRAVATHHHDRGLLAQPALRP
ncbi:putative monooxygenase [Mycobacterium xenopi 3993]|nr:putative monooxygenase [Mycobacterium xenopi 3993]